MQQCEDGTRCGPAVVLHFDVAEGAVGEQNVVASIQIESTAGETSQAPELQEMATTQMI